MKSYKIIQYPDPILRKVAPPVKVFDRKLASAAQRMIATMYRNKGVGLAGPQVNLLERILVIDTSENRDQPRVVINPEILHSEGKIAMEEGCLSIPDVRIRVVRAAQVTVKAQDELGRFFQVTASDLEAVVFQHEIDHLNGVLILDYASPEAEFGPQADSEKPSRLASR
jgi:peptide deformylase